MTVRAQYDHVFGIVLGVLGIRNYVVNLKRTQFFFWAIDTTIPCFLIELSFNEFWYSFTT